MALLCSNSRLKFAHVVMRSLNLQVTVDSVAAGLAGTFSSWTTFTAGCKSKGKVEHDTRE